MLKDTWIDKKNGEDIVDANDINSIAQSVIDLEETSGQSGSSMIFSVEDADADIIDTRGLYMCKGALSNFPISDGITECLLIVQNNLNSAYIYGVTQIAIYSPMESVYGYAGSLSFVQTRHYDTDIGSWSAWINGVAVDTYSLKNNCVTEAKLAANAVSTRRIADAAVTSTKIADDAITAEKISDEAITAIVDKVIESLPSAEEASF